MVANFNRSSTRGLQVPLRIPNNVSAELFLVNSELDLLVTTANDALDAHKFGAKGILKVTQNMLKKACPDYCPSTSTENDTLCKSGEIDGTAFRAECNKCRVSQFSASGFFSGEIQVSITDSGFIPISVLIPAMT
jgi:hypothetical protein